MTYRNYFQANVSTYRNKAKKRINRFVALLLLMLIGKEKYIAIADIFLLHRLVPSQRSNSAGFDLGG